MPIQLSFHKKSTKIFTSYLQTTACFQLKKNSPQLNLFHSSADQLDQKHPLYQLANKIN